MRQGCDALFALQLTALFADAASLWSNTGVWYSLFMTMAIDRRASIKRSLLGQSASLRGGWSAEAAS